MGKILNKIRKNPPGTVITDEWKLMVEGLSRGKLLQYLMKHKTTLNILMSLMGRRDPGQVKALHSLTRMTITPTKSNAGEKTNVIPDRAELGFDIRLLPGQDYSDVTKYFHKTLGKLLDKVELIQELYWTGSSDVWDNPLIDSIAKINKKYQPDTEIMPLFVSGGTDARFFRELGTKCYSTSILTKKVTSEVMGQIFHGIDERVPVEAVENTTLFFKDLAIDFL